MLKISKGEYINEDDIECVSEYVSKPVIKFAKDAKEKGMEREFRNTYGLNTIIIMQDGKVFLCPNKFELYKGRMNEQEFIITDPKRCMIRRKYVVEITSKPNHGQNRDIQKAKEEGMYLNLASNKPTRWRFFMKSGRIYGVHTMKADVATA